MSQHAHNLEGSLLVLSVTRSMNDPRGRELLEQCQEVGQY